MKAVASLSFVLLLSIVRSALSQADPCAKWERTRDTKGNEQFYQPHIDTEDMCKIACMAFPDCEALDWIPNENKKCHHHYAYRPHQTEAHSGSNYWKITRNAVCRVNCTDAFRGKERRRMEGNASFVHAAANTVGECMAVCLARDACHGFEWWDDRSQGERCVIQGDTETGSRRDPQFNTVYYEIGRPYCKDNMQSTLDGFIDKVKGQQKDNRYDTGFCVQWKLYPDFARDAGTFQKLNTEDLCKRLCIVAFPKCRSVDWTGDRKCYHYYDRFKEPTIKAPGTSHWIIERNPCTGQCMEWKRQLNNIESNGAVNEDIQSEEMCKIKCVLMSPECRSIDWAITMGAQITAKCYHNFHLPSGGFHSPGTVHWNLEKVPCSDPLQQMANNTSIETCAEWLGFPNAKVAQESFQPHVTSEDMCKKTCMAFSKCDAIDWRPNDDKKCYHLEEEGVLLPIPAFGSQFWRVYRDGECKVDCVEAIRARERSQFNGDGQRHKDANTMPQCKKACIARSGCFGFNWFDINSEGQKCTLQFDTKSTTQMNSDSTYYEIGRPRCNDPTKKMNASIDRCIDAFRKHQGMKFEDEGERQFDVNVLADCKAACLSRVKCYGFDWLENNPDGHRCFLQSKPEGNTKTDAEAVYYQIGIPGSSCRGSCIDWKMTSDMVAGKGAYQNDMNEEDCKLSCIKTLPNCQSADWVPNTTSPCVHHAAEEVEEMQTQVGSAHWKIKTVPCTGICTELEKHPETEFNYAFHQAGVTSEIMCKIKCMATFPGCQSLDWVLDGGGVCYHHFNGINQTARTNLESVHWKVIQVPCQESCGKWKETADTRLKSGTFLPDILSEDMCKMACMLNSTCRSVDWLPDESRKCFLHFEANQKIFFWNAVNWEFQRTRSCEMVAPPTTTTTTTETPTTTTKMVPQKIKPTTTVTTRRRVTTAQMEEPTTEGEKKGGSSIIIVLLVVGVIAVVIAIFAVRRFRSEAPKSDEEKELLEKTKAQANMTGPDGAPLYGPEGDTGPITVPIIIETTAPDEHLEPAPTENLFMTPTMETEPPLTSPPGLTVTPAPRATPSKGTSKGDQLKRTSRKDGRESKGDQLKKTSTKTKGPNEKPGKEVRRTPSMDRREREARQKR